MRQAKSQTPIINQMFELPEAGVKTETQREHGRSDRTEAETMKYKLNTKHDSTKTCFFFQWLPQEVTVI